MGSPKVLIVFSLIISLMTTVAAQSLSEKAAEEESGLSRILRTSGLLAVRESHTLKDVPTVKSKITCELMVVRNLLSEELAGKEESLTIGLILKSKEEYSTRTANIDPEEIDGLIASIELIQSKGMEFLSASSVPQEYELAGTVINSSSEIHYRTKEGLILAAFENRGSLTFGIKVSSTADWELLKSTGSNPGIEILLSNLKSAKTIADEVLMMINEG